MRFESMYFHKCLCFVLFLILFPLSLFSQTSREIKVYVPPVAGVGSMADAAYFYKQITYEVVLQYNSPVRNLQSSDYTLRGAIAHYTGESFSFLPSINLSEELLDTSAEHEAEAEYETDSENDEFVFRLELVDSKTNTVLGQQEIIFLVVDSSVDELISVIIYNLLSGIPDIIEGLDWRDKYLFLSGALLWAPRLYEADYQSISIANAGLSIMAEFHFLPYMALGLGMEFTNDWVVVSAAQDESYLDFVMEFPLIIKGVFKLSDFYSIEPYAGVKFNLSVTNLTAPFWISWLAGFEFGFKAGQGMVTINPRFAMDFDSSYITSTSQEYSRYMLQLGVGYKLGFFKR